MPISIAKEGPRNDAKGMTLYCHATETELGEMTIAISSYGLCFLGFGAEEPDLQRHCPQAVFVKDAEKVEPWFKKTLAVWRDDPSVDLPIHLMGTAFQRKVWRALLEIKFGATMTYGDIAQNVGNPKGSRAVGGAVGANPVSLIVPCHRVLPSTGKSGHYGWGANVKRVLLSAENIAFAA